MSWEKNIEQLSKSVKENKPKAGLLLIILVIIITYEIFNFAKYDSIVLIITLFIKTFIGFYKLNGYNQYYHNNSFNNMFNNFIINCEKIINGPIINFIKVFKNYLPFIILNGIIMLILYIIKITKFRVDLSLANNCDKSKYTVEYVLIRNKIFEFTREYDSLLIHYMVVMILSFIVAILIIVICFWYKLNISILYAYIIPILLFLVIFGIIVVHEITKNGINPEYLTYKHTDINAGYFILYLILLLIFIASLFIIV
jgi:hypothetical protein